VTSNKIDPPPQLFNLIFEYVSRYSSWRLRKDGIGVLIIDIYPVTGSWSSSASLILGFEASTDKTEQIDVFSHFHYSLPYLVAIIFVILCCFPLSFLVALAEPLYGMLMFIAFSLVLIRVYLSKRSRNIQVENLLQQLTAISSVNLHRNSSIERIYRRNNKQIS
jgi:Ca2+/Na+ antiporter